MGHKTPATHPALFNCASGRPAALTGDLAGPGLFKSHLGYFFGNGVDRSRVYILIISCVSSQPCLFKPVRHLTRENLFYWKKEIKAQIGEINALWAKY